MPDNFVSNVGCREAFERIPVSAYGKYWDNPSIVSGMNWVTSENGSLGYLETDPSTASSVARTGGSYSSVYVGPWAKYTYLGIHLDLQTQVLRERYIDQGLCGLFTFIRPSLRFALPSLFYETIGIITL